MDPACNSTFGVVTSYEAVQVLLPILSGDVTPERIRQELEGLRQNNEAVNSDVFDGKTISFDGNGDRIELANRILVTVDKEENTESFNQANPFQVVDECP